MLDELWERVDGIHGWLRREEAEVLYDLAVQCLPGEHVVEIGSYWGRSTVALALGMHRSGARVHAVDPHDPYTEPDIPHIQFGPDDNAHFFQNIVMSHVSDYVFVINLRSEQVAQVWDRPLAGVYIDGCHEADVVALDAERWSQHIQPGGWIAFHDRRWPGVKAVIKRMQDDDWLLEADVDQIAVLRRNDERGE